MSSVHSDTDNAANAGADVNSPGATDAPAPAPPETNSQPDTSAHLVAFFAQYPEFSYDPTRPALGELKRMNRQYKWDNATYQSSDVHGAFWRALVLQFNLTYGTNQNDLGSWQNLCHAMGLVDTIFVNLVDLVDMPNTGKAVRLFNTEQELSKYSKRTKKIFPREDARAGGLLKHLLRQIARPRRGDKTKAKKT